MLLRADSSLSMVSLDRLARELPGPANLHLPWCWVTGACLCAQGSVCQGSDSNPLSARQAPCPVSYVSSLALFSNGVAQVRTCGPPAPSDQLNFLFCPAGHVSIAICLPICGWQGFNGFFAILDLKSSSWAPQQAQHRQLPRMEKQKKTFALSCTLSRDSL